MNDLYKNELRLYKNFFMPNVKLIKKESVGKHGEKIRKKYDIAKTPCQRVLACDQIDEKTKKRLRKQYGELNPAALRRNILSKIEKLNRNINKINEPKIVIPIAAKVTFTNHLTK